MNDIELRLRCMELAIDIEKDYDIEERLRSAKLIYDFVKGLIDKAIEEDIARSRKMKVKKYLETNYDDLSMRQL